MTSSPIRCRAISETETDAAIYARVDASRRWWAAGHRAVTTAALVGCLGAAGCGRDSGDAARPADADSTPPAAAAAGCGDPPIREVVASFGERMRTVSLLAPADIRDGEMRRAYSALVTPALLREWLAAPEGAPGRLTSSPWPARIDVLGVAAAPDGACAVEGEVVYLTSAERSPGSVTSRERVAITVEPGPPPLIASYTTSVDTMPAAEPSVEDAAAVLTEYYRAISAGEYRAAYALWAGDGEASGQSFTAFAAGYSETERAAIEIGSPDRIEPAAGSRFVRFPVVVTAHTASGATQRFEGSYTLRRAVVDGATPAQRAWRIYSASIRRADGG